MSQAVTAKGETGPGVKKARLGMVIDLKKCIGCNACKSENSTPPDIFWAKVLEREEGEYPTAKRVVLPVLCNHCKDPACLRVCPSGATNQRPDGIVLVDQDKCTGCKACVTACPYDARSFLERITGYYGDELTPYEKIGYTKHQEGTVGKCTFCVHRVDNGLQPACVATCPTACRIFGDLNDPDSEISKQLRSRHAFQLLPEHGTDPSVK